MCGTEVTVSSLRPPVTPPCLCRLAVFSIKTHPSLWIQGRANLGFMAHQPSHPSLGRYLPPSTLPFTFVRSTSTGIARTIVDYVLLSSDFRSSVSALKLVCFPHTPISSPPSPSPSLATPLPPFLFLPSLLPSFSPPPPSSPFLTSLAVTVSLHPLALRHRACVWWVFCRLDVDYRR